MRLSSAPQFLNIWSFLKKYKNSTTKFDLVPLTGPLQRFLTTKESSCVGNGSFFKSILYYVQSTLNLLLNAFSPFLLVSLQMTLTSWELRSGWGHPAISSTLTRVIHVYFRTTCVFIYKRSWPEHAPACSFQAPTPPILSSPSLLYTEANWEIFFVFLFLYCSSSSLLSLQSGAVTHCWGFIFWW